MPALRKHAIVGRWSTGGFHVERHIRCRCGWVGTHYNAGEVKRRYDEHKRTDAEQEPQEGNE